jgi:hypothetical protein
MELGLETMDTLWYIFNMNSDKKTPFYVNFYTMILHETIKVLTDYKHMSGFKLQATILSKLIQTVQSEDGITSPVFDKN